MSSQPAPEGKALKDRVRAAWKRLRGGALSPSRAASSIAIGVFVGCLPLYGVHSVIVLAICVPLRLDSAVAYVSTHVSNPVTAPFLFALEMQLGSLLLTGHATTMSFAAAKELGFLKVGARLFVGAAVVAPASAIVAALVAFFLTHRVQDAREPARAEARRRTLARYRRSGVAVRVRVWWSLITDPLFEALRALTGSFGRIVDVGCGAGHRSLSLLDRGRASSLLGIDSNPAVIALARAAAGNSAGFEFAALETCAVPEADTIFVIEVLHLLSAEGQDALLRKAAVALAPGGRLVVRAIAPGVTLRSRLTQRFAAAWARRRGHEGPLVFRAAEEHHAALEREGLVCRVAAPENTGVLDAVLLVGEKPRLPSALPSSPGAAPPVPSL